MDGRDKVTVGGPLQDETGGTTGNNTLGVITADMMAAASRFVDG